MFGAKWHRVALSRLNAEIREGRELLSRTKKQKHDGLQWNSDIIESARIWFESAAFATWFASDGRYLDDLERLGHSPTDLSRVWRKAPDTGTDLHADILLHLRMLRQAKEAFRSITRQEDVIHFELLRGISHSAGAMLLSSAITFLKKRFNLEGNEPERVLVALEELGILHEDKSLGILSLTAEGWEYIRRLGNGGAMIPPKQIEDSLLRFRSDHPSSRRSAFIMMRFARTKAHTQVVSAIRSVLAEHGITGLRADDKEYNDDLFQNIMTYMYGCAFGIAVFERIEGDDFNPNVSLEVGYMMAMAKPVCFLKDRTLKTLHTDLVGKMYRTFDPFDPVATIRNELGQWLKDQGFALATAPSH